MNNRREQIRQRREGLGMSRAMLARAAGLTAQALYNVEEKPERNVAPDTIERLWVALDERERGSTPSGSGAELRAELDALKAEVAALTSGLLADRERMRVVLERLGIAPEQQPGGLQGLEPRPPVRQPRP